MPNRAVIVGRENPERSPKNGSAGISERALTPPVKAPVNGYWRDSGRRVDGS